LIQSVFDEIGRNGFKKIVVLNAHGGNTHLLRFLAQCSLWEQKPYSLYIPLERMSSEGQEGWKAMRETDFGGHACETETSGLLGTFPDLVKMDQVPEEAATPLGRMQHLPPTFAGISWYSDFPDHYAGDARPATEEKGRALVDLLVDNLAAYIAAVKADQVVPTLETEFYRRVENLNKD
jgi:creatinine amidohydrolase